MFGIVLFISLVLWENGVEVLLCFSYGILGCRV